MKSGFWLTAACRPATRSEIRRPWIAGGQLLRAGFGWMGGEDKADVEGVASELLPRLRIQSRGNL